MIVIITISFFYTWYHWNNCYRCHHTDMASCIMNQISNLNFSYVSLDLFFLKKVFLRDCNGYKAPPTFLCYTCRPISYIFLFSFSITPQFLIVNLFYWVHFCAGGKYLLTYLFSYLFIFLIIKLGGSSRQNGVVCEQIFIKIGYPNKMIVSVKIE